MEILQTPSFNKQVKKLHTNQRKELEQVIRIIFANPTTLGKAKKGDLSGIYVYKFRMLSQLSLLAYQYNTSQLVLVALGSHENFYRDLKHH
jgi:mRNA-degrading endonuclease RelE of RelBE toxin-antitoxin system